MTSRRDFLEKLTIGSTAAMGAALAGCAGPGVSTESGAKPLRAAFSNAGLQSTWCELGKRTAELWGKLLNVEIEWFDGEMDPARQRDKIDSLTNRDWDFCCFQAVQIDSLAEPCLRLKERGIPVISMDTLLVSMDKMRSTGVWCEVTPDHVEMAEKSVGYLMEKIGGQGKVIHIGGLDGHSGAQGRRQGFENVLKRFPNVEVLGGGVRWCDWKPEKARNTFEALLQQETTPIAGAFFHSDDMALGSIPALKGTVHEKMVVVAVDGQKDGLNAIKNGVLAASAVNPVCRIHQTALIVGQFIVRNKEPIESVPSEIITPGPLVTADNPRALEAMYYLADPAHCLV
ncbi:sugar ABC transporter substrate-binding protein [Schlesneria paludicola]|uniref:sugar ABC transporter substrate-binding protein n=1 Tax=Schlesneria paludicola TaxID=360056 RepID=UPI00029A1289|nr:sugar ABC transporter substrate-binding protein [Schlesneria paludicola]